MSNQLKSLRMPKSVSVVVPALNESGNISALIAQIGEKLRFLRHYEIIIIDDGSSDNTLSILQTQSKKNTHLRYISFSRNFGHQIALRAGIEHASGDLVICMDADLQHPPKLLTDMIDKWSEGFDIVFMQRFDPESLPWIKRMTSRLFYRVLNIIGDNNVQPGSADFCLMDRLVVNVIKSHREANIFFRGLLPRLGFNATSIPYSPDERLYGETNYGLKKMVSLAITGFVSTSTKPLRLATYFAVIIGMLTAIYAGYTIYAYLFIDGVVTGWTSLILVVSSLGAIQLFILGIFGEYLAQTLRETRSRPHYIVKDCNVYSDKTDHDIHLASRNIDEYS